MSNLNLSSDCLVTNEIIMTNTLLHHAKGGCNGEKVCERQTGRSVCVCGGQGMHRCMLAALLFSSQPAIMYVNMTNLSNFDLGSK